MKSSAIEMFDSSVHRNQMPDVPAPEPAREVLVIAIAKFRLEFLSNAQLEAAIAYFRKPSNSTRQCSAGGDHWEFQPWQSRLPAGINNAHNRPKVLAALVAARPLENARLL